MDLLSHLALTKRGISNCKATFTPLVEFQGLKDKRQEALKLFWQNVVHQHLRKFLYAVFTLICHLSVVATGIIAMFYHPWKLAPVLRQTAGTDQQLSHDSKGKNETVHM